MPRVPLPILIAAAAMLVLALVLALTRDPPIDPRARARALQVLAELDARSARPLRNTAYQ